MSLTKEIDTVSNAPGAARIVRGWPANWLTALLPAVAIALGVAATSGPYSAQYREWVLTSAALHESLALAGPFIAAWAAATGHLLAGRRLYFGSIPSTRRPAQIATHVGLIVGVSVVAIILGWLPSAAQSMQSATWGHPSFFDLAIMVAGVAAISTVSFVAGSFILQGRLVILVPLAVALYLQLPNLIDRAFSVTSPVQSWKSSVRFGPNPAVAIYFLLFAALVIPVSSTVFVARTRPSINGLALALTPIVLMMAIPFLWRPDLYSLRSDPAPDCRSIGGVRVCVHPAHRRSLRNWQRPYAGSTQPPESRCCRPLLTQQPRIACSPLPGPRWSMSGRTFPSCRWTATFT